HQPNPQSHQRASHFLNICRTNSRLLQMLSNEFRPKVKGRDMADHSEDGPRSTPRRLRSRDWMDNPENPSMTAFYLGWYLNFGLTREELQSGKPIIGIAQTGSDLSPCNRHHIILAQRVREGIREAGGIAIEFP